MHITCWSETIYFGILYLFVLFQLITSCATIHSAGIKNRHNKCKKTDQFLQIFCKHFKRKISENFQKNFKAIFIYVTKFLQYRLRFHIGMIVVIVQTNVYNIAISLHYLSVCFIYNMSSYFMHNSIKNNSYINKERRHVQR